MLSRNGIPMPAGRSKRLFGNGYGAAGSDGYSAEGEGTGAFSSELPCLDDSTG